MSTVTSSWVRPGKSLRNYQGLLRKDTGFRAAVEDSNCPNAQEIENNKKEHLSPSPSKEVSQHSNFYFYTRDLDSQPQPLLGLILVSSVQPQIHNQLRVSQWNLHQPNLTVSTPILKGQHMNSHLTVIARCVLDFFVSSCTAQTHALEKVVAKWITI